MDVQSAPTASTSSREQQISPRLHGRWLVLARVGWVSLVILTLVIVCASFPGYLAQLQTPCTGIACQSPVLLTPELAGILKGVGLDLRTYAAYTVALTLVSMIVCFGVSAVIAWRRSDDRMALITAAMLVALAPGSETDVVQASPSPWQLPNACLTLLSFASLLLVGLLFPSGRFVPRWTSLMLVVFLAVSVPFTFFPNAPFSLNSDALLLYYLLSLVVVAIVAVVQLYRYRRVSSPLQRQQTKWVAYGIAVLFLVQVVGYGLMFSFPALTAPSSLYPLVLNVASYLTALLIPLSFGFAMLRYRLWDIDVLISRTLVYGALTLILTAVYGGLVIGLSALLRGVIQLGGQDNNAALVLSTLAIAALFQPLRKSLQTLIDRRFYRRKYDAAKTLQGFSQELSNKVDLQQLSEQLVAVVSETMQPSSISLWLCQSRQGKRADETASLGTQREAALLSLPNTIESIGLVKEKPHD